MKINHISVSRAETYQQCHLRYRYRYHDEIIPGETPFYFTFGKIVHKVIEEYTSKRGEVPISQIQNDIIEGRLEIEPGKKAPEMDYPDRARLNLHLVNFLKLSHQIGLGGEVEWPFEVDLDPPNKRMWVGFIDRIIEKKGHYFIVDWKTTKPGKWRKDRTTIRKDLQIQGYCYVVKQHFNVPAGKIRAALYYLEDGKLVDSGHFSEQTLMQVPQNLLRMFQQIERTDPLAVVGRTGEHCNRCDYKGICPFFKEYRTGVPMGGIFR